MIHTYLHLHVALTRTNRLKPSKKQLSCENWGQFYGKVLSLLFKGLIQPICYTESSHCIQDLPLNTYLLHGVASSFRS